MKKIFDPKRAVMILGTAAICACGFVFVKICADTSSAVKTDAEPSDEYLVTEPAEDILAGVEADISLDVTEEEMPEVIEPVTEPPQVTSVPETEETLPTESSDPEQMVDKIEAGRGLMRLLAATRVPDIVSGEEIESATVTKAPEAEETKSSSAKKSEAATKATEKPSTKASASETEPPETEKITPKKSDETSETEKVDNAPEKADTENVDESNSAVREDIENESEEPEPDESVDVYDPPEDSGFVPMTDEEMMELLSRLGVSEQSNVPPASGNVVSSGSYKNQTVTIYDTTYGALRTGNAFDIVAEVVNIEVGDSFELEAIKAQAVAAYTYIKYYEQKGEYAELGTKANPSDKVLRAVEAVDGLALYYDGQYIMTPFSASQGGYSASSKNVWGGDLPYLQSVRNDFDYLDTKYYGKVTTYTVEELRSIIQQKTGLILSENYADWVRVLSNNDMIYVGNMAIDGHTSVYVNGRERTLTGHIFRTYILPLKSAAFTVSYANGVFTFTTYGYGHGVGLSQIGANLYAKNGWTFDKILLHYFTGVTLK